VNIHHDEISADGKNQQQIRYKQMPTDKISKQMKSE